MSYIKTEIESRNIPDVLKFADGTAVTKENVSERRAEILDILQKHEYGYMPPAPDFAHAQKSLVGYNPWGCRVRHD